ncbi:oxalate decarboxylase [Gloeophyllum trabeum ATCC 11539]|uniref:Oxalate decarboxylase n=1 Tax=Gloeophyllum trabeum (strain ATCC 11539 / FP-39264 / Madison 617) TaxID=670483 RepID=S7QHR9_GLOTA|nr:oxalate decarboxylase [Gloeophyllum trabeum ATCC 11539]EPQ59336.1 oxalate decarboxylase [Gloeophyllum trabeum ATCC 11539]
MFLLSVTHIFLSLSAFVCAAPAGTTSASAADSSPTVPLASDNPNYPLWNDTVDYPPQPIRGPFGANQLGPQNIAIDKQNPDLLAPPTTDAGTVLNAKWPLALSHNQLHTGGWARQQNTQELPIATQMAGVDMRLEPGAIRELHWHSADEWAYILKGSTQVTAVDQDGRNFLETLNQGDLWYFPAGVPHSLQATDDNPEGCEFILVFDSGDFSDFGTFLLTDWLAHVPKEVIAKNFGSDIAAWNGIPGEQLYIFPSNPPPDNATSPSDPQGSVPESFGYRFSQVPATQLAGGTVKVADSRTFKAAKKIAVAEVTVEPGAMRQWHPTEDEWAFFLEGNARMTMFAAEGNAATFDFQASHYVENTGNTTLHYLEIFHTDIYQDVSLSQWLALVPPALVKAHLNISDELIATFNKTKATVVAPDPYLKAF